MDVNSQVEYNATQLLDVFFYGDQPRLWCFRPKHDLVLTKNKVFFFCGGNSYDFLVRE